MTENPRPDGKSFVFDNRGKAPRYVIEGGEDGEVMTNQFTGKSVKIEERTWSGYSRAFKQLKRIEG